MPTYSYRCTECDHVFDLQSSISARNEPKECPECGEEAKKNWSGEGVVPMPMHESFADGHIPSSRKGMMREAAEAMRLKSEAYSMDHRKRADINKEISKIDHATQTTHKAKPGEKD